MTKAEAKQIIDSSEYFWLRPTEEERKALSLAVNSLEIDARYDLEYEDTKATGQWIDIHDRFPEGKAFDSFLVCYENGAVVTEQLWCICDFDYNEHIVAWMPLPKPYKR